MSTDAEGHPYIVTYWRDADSEVPQYRLVWNDGKGWQNRQIMNRSQGFSLKGGGTKMIPISRPRIGRLILCSVMQNVAARFLWLIQMM